MGADKRSFPPFRKEKIPQSHSPIGAPPNAACPSLSCATPAPRSLAPGLLPHALSPSEKQAAPQDKQTATSVPSFS